MTDWTKCEEVEQTPGRIRDALVLKGTRMPLFALCENLVRGVTVKELVEWSPGVEEEQVRAFLEHEAKFLCTSLAM